jgi:XTP/dITP diphosphohydrolase
MAPQQENEIVIASGNPGKLRELDSLLAGCGRRAVPQTEHNVPEAAETGTTFVENALIKARNAAAHTGLAALADDSGIEVDALGGAPGVYSARYAGAGAGDEANNRKLLAELEGVPFERRTARYQCLIVFFRHADDPTPLICHGHWEGVILTEPRGRGGFGYDPLFWLPDRQCSAAELPADEKNRISHRGLALQQLLDQLAPPQPAAS